MERVSKGWGEHVKVEERWEGSGETGMAEVRWGGLGREWEGWERLGKRG